MKEEKAIITPHTPCMSDIIKDLKMDTKEQNLTTSEYLEFAKNYVLNYEVSKDQREQISLITVGQSSNSNNMVNSMLKPIIGLSIELAVLQAQWHTECSPG